MSIINHGLWLLSCSIPLYPAAWLGGDDYLEGYVIVYASRSLFSLSSVIDFVYLKIIFYDCDLEDCF